MAMVVFAILGYQALAIRDLLLVEDTGVQCVVRIGDPAKAGDLSVLRAKYPPNYRKAPHTHLDDETLTVLTGSLGVGMGEKVETKGEMLKAGSLWIQPAKPAHDVWMDANEETIVHVQRVGPGGIEFVNSP